ncbi:MAG TPA: beta-galactosidase, partial [Candidatus Dormibacteraeota bacterium]|nr:beta-galactosidase [Candidatus Dormibacteraeota bacterium]
GQFSYKLTNKSGFAPNVYARVVQVVTGMQPYTTYKVSCWAKGKGCGINWIGGGPGWFNRHRFPEGDFDWQQVTFEIEAGATPGDYELMVLSESQTEALWVDDVRFEPVHVDQAKQDALYKELDERLERAKRKLEKLRRIATAGNATNDAYFRLGAGVAERFITFAENGTAGLPVSLDWTRLQLEEVEQVLDQTEGSPALRWQAPRVGKVKLQNGTFYQNGEPYYFAGYGHFDSVIKDLPNFPGLGASLVQDGRAGPSSMNEDGSLLAGATNVLFGLDRAKQFGMRVDFLLSPHYYPGWGTAPDLQNGNIGFLNFNIFHPKAKTVVQRWAEVMARRLKEKPALHSVCLANEQVYISSGRDAYTRPDYIEYLVRKHKTISTLNELYGTSYTNFEQVVVPAPSMPGEQGAKRAYYDWTSFNKEMFANWHGWFDSTLKHAGLKAPTHTKIMVFQSYDRDKLAYGVDPELMCEATDLAGCDDYAFMSGAYAYDWLGEEFFYDLLHSFRGQSVFNSENHLIPDGSGSSHIPMNHSRAVIWQGGLHHQGSTTIWVWEQAADPSLAGSIYFRPANIYGAGRAMLDLNRLSREVKTVNEAKPSVALLYSQPSIFWEPKYQGTSYSLYTVLNFLGLNVSFISERQLAAGKAAKVPWLVVPKATHVLPTTAAALKGFVKAGGRVLLVGKESLRWDEYDRTTPDDGDGFPIVEMQGERQMAGVLRQKLAGVHFEDVKDAATGKPAWGVEFCSVEYRGATLLPMINLNKEPRTVELAGRRSHEGVDLVSGERVNLARIHLEPMLPRLLRISP